jgi:hypothetical protein
MQQPFHAGFWIGRDDPLSELLHDVKANKKGEPIFSLIQEHLGQSGLLEIQSDNVMFP